MIENLLNPHWLEKKPRFAFLIGMIYTAIGILAAWIVFPRSQGIASIAFISMLFIPSLNSILRIEEEQDCSRANKKFTLGQIFKDHADILEIYFMLFLGIFLAYALFSLQFPNLLVSGIFDNQLRVIGVTGQATASSFNFFSIFANNFKVMIIFLVLSLVFGAGSILFLTWNASVWGVVFAYIATMSENAFDAFTSIFVKVLPHMFAEAGAYFFAIVAGGIMAQGVLREKFGSKKFEYVLKDGFAFLTVALLLLILGAVLEVYLYPLL